MSSATLHSSFTHAFPYNLVKTELAAIDNLVSAQIAAFDPEVQPYMDYICASSGKRIRPSLCILSGGALGALNENHTKLGLIVELIHMATLVHDDIIDGADKRRMLKTANAKWGNSLSVLLGDALFSHALTTATDFNNIEICRAIGRASRDVFQGEVLQTRNRFNPEFSRNDYFRVIEMKTGALFAVSMSLAAKLSETTPDLIQAFYQAGMKLGTAYQIYDDCLDVLGVEEQAGKTLHTDFLRGKITLPILNALDLASESQRKQFENEFRQKRPADILGMLDSSLRAQAINQAINQALICFDEVKTTLSRLPSSPYQEGFVELVHFLHELVSQQQQS